MIIKENFNEFLDDFPAHFFVGFLTVLLLPVFVLGFPFALIGWLITKKD